MVCRVYRQLNPSKQRRQPTLSTRGTLTRTSRRGKQRLRIGRFGWKRNKPVCFLRRRCVLERDGNHQQVRRI